MEIRRDDYLNQLMAKEHNGLIKIVTGVRRCGKSYLLFRLFRKHLLEQGVPEDHIIEIVLDDRRNKRLRDPDVCLDYVISRTSGEGSYYVLLDEVQLMPEFEDVLNTFLHMDNVDVYVTGSNSRFLSSDIATQFRGRGDEIRVYPLSFREFLSSGMYSSRTEAWNQYYTYGGMPFILQLSREEDKAAYLQRLFEETYLRDIVERHHIRNDAQMEELVDLIASSVGSLTSVNKLANTFQSRERAELSAPTVKQYLNYLEEAFLVEKAVRYDIRGKKYIGAPCKYYFSDVGLRNARLNFRQQEENHIMENIIYNELRIRGYSVDVGMVELSEKDASGRNSRKQTEVDFVANRGSRRYYIQSAWQLPTEEKREKEERPLIHIPDSFRKILVVRDDTMLKRDDRGIVTMGILEFLLDRNSLDL